MNQANSETTLIAPWDSHNQKLIAAVHPLDWVNPQPKEKYNLVVIGAGTAGLVTAAGAAGLGAKVALIERHLMGGDCLNVGCVPSKALIHSGRIAASIRSVGEVGITAENVRIDFAQTMARLRKLRAGISKNDSVARFTSLGVDVFLGEGKFLEDGILQVGEQRLHYSKAVIATGARAAAPDIPGLADIPYLTNETIFNLTECPKRLLVLGGGPIGAELAQALARLGSQVTLVEKSRHILSREDEDAAMIVQESLQDDGVTVHCQAAISSISRSEQGIIAQIAVGENRYEVTVDQLLVAVGRAPNVEGLNLEGVQVEYNQSGVIVNDRLQTTNKRIYAAGDICGSYKFTHAADFMARTVLQNALFMGSAKLSQLIVPWCTYTEPELAHVGLNEAHAQQRGIPITTFQQDMNEVDRAILEGETNGFVKIHVKKGTDKIVGATIVAKNAGDMISTITMAMKHKIGLGKIASVIHPYPTQAEAIRKLGDAYNRTRLTPFVKWAMRKWLDWTR